MMTYTYVHTVQDSCASLDVAVCSFPLLLKLLVCIHVLECDPNSLAPLKITVSSAHSFMLLVLEVICK